MSKRKQQNCNQICKDNTECMTSKGICRTFRSKTTTSTRTCAVANVLLRGLKRDISNLHQLNDKFHTLIKVAPKDI